MRILCLLAPRCAALALAACGGAKTRRRPARHANRPALDQKTKQAMLDFARCMRQHGVDMPDPKFDGGGAVIRASGKGMTRSRCGRPSRRARSTTKQIKPPAIPKAEQEKFKQAGAGERALHARARDRHAGSAVRRRTARSQQRIGGDIEPTDQKFQAAQKACGGGLIGGQAAP